MGISIAEYKKLVAGTFKKRRRSLEHKEQAALISWRNKLLKQYPELRWLHAIPNGGFRDPITAKILKSEGVEPGVPDLCLPVSRLDPYNGAGINGLYIELKAGNNKPTPDQWRWIEGLRKNGYRVVICYSWTQATEEILKYLNLP